MYICTFIFGKTYKLGEGHRKTNIREHQISVLFKVCFPGLVLNNRIKFTHGTNEIYSVTLRYTL